MQSAYDFLKSGRLHGQGITAGKQHIVDFGMLPDILQAGIHIVVRLVVSLHEEALAETITTEGIARIGYQQ